ncbi:hypothetical protein [Niveibacterium sp. 24ML]|uniref:hypothetical protein n=1 Tax=Niveibacterium sp. 24ML TaxID=2985512 RepID=UPI00226DA9E9|nr:hypothetical protein [Niveibacterium sp. 24ML]
MLDLDRLFSDQASRAEVGTRPEAQADQTAPDVGANAWEKGSASKTQPANEVGFPTAPPPVTTMGGFARPNAGAGFRGVSTFPTVTTSETHDPEPMHGTRAGGEAASSFRAVFSEADRCDLRHEFNPAALVMCFHLMNREGVSNEALGGALRALSLLRPIEQQVTLSRRCAAAGLDGWRLLSFDAPGEERDCMGCANLRSVSGRLTDDDRRMFRWGCALGYPVREVARASERIITAPPDCTSWVRYKPLPR